MTSGKRYSACIPLSMSRCSYAKRRLFRMTRGALRDEVLNPLRVSDGTERAAKRAHRGTEVGSLSRHSFTRRRKAILHWMMPRPWRSFCPKLRQNRHTFWRVSKSESTRRQQRYHPHQLPAIRLLADARLSGSVSNLWYSLTDPTYVFGER